MTIRFFTLFLLIFALFTPGVLLAADAPAPKDCGFVPEAIVNMRTPEYPSSAAWVSQYAEKDHQQNFTTGVVPESGNVLVAGERATYGQNDIDLILVQLDNHGRITWDKTHHVKGLRSVVKMIAGERGVWIVGQRQLAKGKADIWLGFFDPGGELLHTQSVHDTWALTPTDVIPMAKGGYLLAASGEDNHGAHRAIIYRLNGKMGVVSHNAYALGLDNQVLSLSPSGPDNYMASGTLQVDDGRMAGWLMLLDKSANIVWQRQYARGHAAKINRTIDFSGDYVAAVGQTIPVGSGNGAGWVMMVSRVSGDIAWQRYYTGKLSYNARDVLVEGGGVFSVLLNARRPEKSEEPVIARLLTLNPRGQALANDVFPNAEGAHAAQLLAGKQGERVIVGSTDGVTRTDTSNRMGPAIPLAPGVPAPQMDGSVQVVRGLDGWVIAAVPAVSWEDPCAAPKQTQAAP